MGCGFSKPLTAEQLRSKQIDDELKREAKHNFGKYEVKILLLGTGESGKSTVMKQIRLINEGPFGQTELWGYREPIWLNLLEFTRVLLSLMLDNDVHFENKESLDIAPRLLNTSSTQMIQQELWLIEQLIKDKAVQCFLRRYHGPYLDNSAFYFFQHIARISSPDYMPTENDILRCRVRTTGILECKIKTGHLLYTFIDVGGQRSERRKWIHCFSNVTSLIFLAAISEYGQSLLEDKNTNRIREALWLFDLTINSPWFKNTPIILFLNKVDILRGKLAHSDIRKEFPDYKADPLNLDSACDFFRRKFLALDKSSHRQIYTHYTCATDGQQIKFVMGAVNDIVTRISIAEVGLL